MNKVQSDLWFFYEKVDKKRLGPFSIDSLCKHFISNQLDLDQICLARPGWDGWKNCLDIPDFITRYQSYFKDDDYDLPPIEADTAIVENKLQSEINFAEDLPPQLPIKPALKLPPRPLEILVKEVKVVEQLHPEIEKNVIDKRKHPRFDMELKAVFIVDKKSFRTKTLNISLGGIKIVDALPDYYFNRQIQVYLSSSDLKFSIKFEAELVHSKNSLSQIQFMSQNEISTKHLESWLQSMYQGQKMITKKTA